MAKREIDTGDLRRAFGTFATGVTVVTTIDADGGPRGFTANSFASVSLEPPLVLVCVAKTVSSCDAFRSAGRYAVNILAEDQKHVSVAFSAPTGERFAAVHWSTRETGCPIITGTVAWLDCRMHEVVEAGDHYILVGRVEDYGHGSQSPLGYCRGAYVTFGLAEEAIRAAEAGGTTSVAAIIEHERALYLPREPLSGGPTLPSAPCMGSADDPASLLGRLAAAGVDAHLSFLFAVYEDQHSLHNIVYRGEARAITAQARASFVAFGDIRWSDIRDHAVHSMLQRYVCERQEDSFGVYVGDRTSGRVKPLAM